jgi:hypothetical protein
MNSGGLHNCLTRLIPHVDAARIALTGGVAIGMHIASVHADSTRAAAAEDVDFVAESVTAIRPTVTSEFLVSHFHLPQSGYPKFLVQLVDPVTRLRLDFFPDTLQALGRALVVDAAGVPLRMLGVDDILEHKIRLLSVAVGEAPAEKKHYVDAVRLGAICGRDVLSLAAVPLVSRAFSQDLDATCPRCQASRSAAFSLAPKRAIFDILGYV